MKRLTTLILFVVLAVLGIETTYSHRPLPESTREVHAVYSASGFILADNPGFATASESALHVAGLSAVPAENATAPTDGRPVPTSAATAMPTPASSQTTTAHSTASEWDHLFEQYGAQYGVDPKKLSVIAKCESTYRQDAVNGPYGGMYQYLASTWSATRTAMGEDPNPDLRFNGEEAIQTTAWKIAHGGIGAWPHCGKL